MVRITTERLLSLFKCCLSIPMELRGWKHTRSWLWNTKILGRQSKWKWLWNIRILGWKSKWKEATLVQKDFQKLLFKGIWRATALIRDWGFHSIYRQQTDVLGVNHQNSRAVPDRI